MSQLSLPLAPGQSMRATLTRNGQSIIDLKPSQFTFNPNPSSYNYNAFVAMAVGEGQASSTTAKIFSIGTATPASSALNPSETENGPLPSTSAPQNRLIGITFTQSTTNQGVSSNPSTTLTSASQSTETPQLTVSSTSSSTQPAQSAVSSASSVTSSTQTNQTSSSGSSASQTLTSSVSNPTGAAGNDSSQKFVFAHHMVGNTFPYTAQDWLNDIKLAFANGIDAFALNIGSDSWQPGHVKDA